MYKFTSQGSIIKQRKYFTVLTSVAKLKKCVLLRADGFPSVGLQMYGRILSIHEVSSRYVARTSQDPSWYWSA